MLCSYIVTGIQAILMKSFVVNSSHGAFIYSCELFAQDLYLIKYTLVIDNHDMSHINWVTDPW